MPQNILCYFKKKKKEKKKDNNNVIPRSSLSSLISSITEGMTKEKVFLLKKYSEYPINMQMKMVAL